MTSLAQIRAAELDLPVRARAGTWTRLLQQRMIPIALAILVVIAVAAVAAPLVAPYDPNATNPSESLVTASWDHPLGTDQLGRDILSRMIYGARISLMVGFVAVGLSMIGGVPLGLISGYFGGYVDHGIMRAMDAVIAFPQIILALAIVGAFGSGMPQVMIAIGIGSVPVYARLTRGQVLAAREQEYVLAAKTVGSTSSRVLIRHILPNTLSPLIVQGSLGVAYAILAEAGLSFLGVGVQPPTPTWGGILSEGLPLVRRAAHPSLYPGIAIFITVLAINLIGDALRDVLDPRLRGER